MNRTIDKQKLIGEYKSGKAVAEICGNFGISKQTLYNLLRAEGCDFRRQKLYEIDGCPLFEKDIYNQIYCMDCGDWEHLSLSFRDKETKNAHKKLFCNCQNYRNCSIYKVMLSQFA